MRLTIVGNPDNRRVALFRAAARAAGLAEPDVIPWRDVACGGPTEFAGDALVRLDSPGEDPEVDRLLRGAGYTAEHGEIVGLAAWHRGFGAALTRATKSDALLTFGIPPTFASTGFGYLETGDEIARGADGSVFRTVKRFVEKPDAATAQRYVDSKRFFWNAGMFVWRAEVFLAEAERNAPGLAKFIREFPSAHPAAGAGQQPSPGAQSAW